jgi:hypothetical protein
VGAVGVIGVAGAALLALLSAGAGSSGPPPRVVDDGTLRLTVEPPWRLAPRAVPGASVLEPAVGRAAPIMLVSGQTTLAAGPLRRSAPVPAGPPPDLVAQYGTPVGLPASVAGRPGVRYDFRSGPGRQLAALVLATTHGDLAFVCVAPSGALAAVERCATVAAHASVGTPTLPPGPDQALAAGLDRALAPAAAARRQLHRLGTGTLHARGRAAGAVATVDSRSARALERLAVPDRNRVAVRAVVAGLRSESEAFAALARAGATGHRTAYANALDRVHATSTRLSAATTALARVQLLSHGLPALTLAAPPRPRKPPHRTASRPAPPAPTPAAAAPAVEAPRAQPRHTVQASAPARPAPATPKVVVVPTQRGSSPSSVVVVPVK